MVNTLLLFFHRVLDVYDYSVYMFKERIIIRVLYSLGYFHIYLYMEESKESVNE
jgi:hypothetical protein